MTKQHWLVKSEPYKYSFEKLEKDGRALWDGVRNFEARNHLRSMRAGDPVLFYHSNEGKAVVGLAEVSQAAFPDPSAKEGDWSAVEIVPKRALGTPVTLSTIKGDGALRDIALLRRPRLSVVPLTDAEFRRLLALGGLGR